MSEEELDSSSGTPLDLCLPSLRREKVTAGLARVERDAVDMYFLTGQRDRLSQPNGIGGDASDQRRC